MDLEREDYQEPHCPFCTNQWQDEAPVRSIPVSRVIEKLDEFYSRDDFSGAVRLIEYWLEEAKDGRDLRGEFALRNELMGIYRKTGKKEPAINNAELALELAEKIGIQGSAAEGTALVNAATVLKAFGEPEASIELFVKARSIYESQLKDDARLGGLYNNMALTLSDLERFDEAEDMFLKAIDVMSRLKDSEAEQAVSYLNLADIAAAKEGMEEAEEKISDYCLKAAELLDTDSLARDGNYAYYCEKCAPVFGYYGFFAAEELFAERARIIHERS